MKKVLLLGDSIRLGYQEDVKELLKDEYEVVFPEDNGRFAAYTLWQVNQMFREHRDIALVHWNNGYWDLNPEAPMNVPMHPIGEYQHFLRRIALFIQSQGAKVIFATTTPILEKEKIDRLTGYEAEITYDNAYVDSYNDAAKAVMAELGIEVNDLHELCMVDERYYKCDDLLHLTAEGSRKCAEAIAQKVRAALG